MSARAIVQPTSKGVTPARAIIGATSKALTPARVIEVPEPIELTSARARLATTSTHASPALLSYIKSLGVLLDDLEAARIAAGNQIAAIEREFGEAPPHLDAIAKTHKQAEHFAELELLRAWRKHPLAPWAKSVQGIGPKSAARLIAAIGNPAERPNVAKLWAYCGIGDPTRKRRKGMSQTEAKQLGNPRAKTAIWQVATDCMKQDGKPDKNGKERKRSPYRDIYDARREATAERLHESSCVRCGPSGSPAQPGSPWSPKHQLADALRITGKRILRDIWIESRALQGRTDTHFRHEGANLDIDHMTYVTQPESVDVF